MADRRETRELVRVRLEVVILRGAGLDHLSAAFFGDVHDRDQLRGRGKRQRFQDEGVERRQRRRVGADADDERAEDREAETGRARERADGEPQASPQVRQRRRTPRVADLLAVGGRGAEFALGSEARVGVGQTLGTEFGDELVEVKLQLGIERGLLAAAVEEAAAFGAQPAEALAVHPGSSISSTLAIAAANAAHCTISASSCFRPARVRR